MGSTTLQVTPKGTIELPAPLTAALGLAAGSQVEVTIDRNHLTLSPKRPKLSPEEVDSILDKMQALFSGQPSLEDDLYAMRREEEEHSRRKYGC